MKEHLRNILIVVSLAAVLVGTLVLASDLFASYMEGSSFVPTYFAFALLEGSNDPANSTVALMISTMSPKFTFRNDTAQWDETTTLETFGIPDHPISFQREYNATWLTSIGIRPHTIVCQPEDLPFNGSYSLTMTMNTTINATLEAMENIDLGTYSCWNESYLISQNDSYSHSSMIGNPTWDNSGYWKRGWEPEDTMWVMKNGELSGMLQGSGTALITFRGVIDLKLDYEITMNKVKRTDVKTLSWQGSLGIIKLTYDQNKLFWMKYEIQAIQLAMLTAPE
jgi:hypothetical protein